jgi:acetyl-CoA/propionyl-CoA carboxylase carboxyl transferase subunit
VHVVADDEADAIEQGRKLATAAGQARESPPRRSTTSTWPPVVARVAPAAYDVHPADQRCTDEGSTVELHARWAPNVAIALGRLGGRTVGVIANNPLRWAAAWTRISARRRPGSSGCVTPSVCPLVVLVDVPGYLPGVGPGVGRGGSRGAKLLTRVRRGVVPRVTLVTRKAYGGAYIAMNARSLGATRSLPGRAPRSP